MVPLAKRSGTEDLASCVPLKSIAFYPATKFLPCGEVDRSSRLFLEGAQADETKNRTHQQKGRWFGYRSGGGGWGRDVQLHAAGIIRPVIIIRHKIDRGDGRQGESIDESSGGSRAEQCVAIVGLDAGCRSGCRLLE